MYIVHVRVLYVFSAMNSVHELVLFVHFYSFLVPPPPPPLLLLQAQRPDELGIRVDEELEVLEWDDGDGWCKGRNGDGVEGYFPQSYVQPSSRSSSPQNVTVVVVPSDGANVAAATPAHSTNTSPGESSCTLNFKL